MSGKHTGGIPATETFFITQADFGKIVEMARQQAGIGGQHMSKNTETPAAMDENTRAALEESIAHWVRVVRGEDRSIDAKECALCHKFIYINAHGHCQGCPVKEKTGSTECSDSPWEKLHRHIHHDHNEWNKEIDTTECDKCKELAQNMLDFLRTLLPPPAKAEPKKAEKAAAEFKVKEWIMRTYPPLTGPYQITHISNKPFRIDYEALGISKFCTIVKSLRPATPAEMYREGAIVEYRNGPLTTMARLTRDFEDGRDDDNIDLMGSLASSGDPIPKRVWFTLDECTLLKPAPQ